MPYIGTSPSNGVRRKHTYTATASQTSFSGAGAEGATLSYNDSNFVDVYQNGVKLSEADYTSTSGTAIVLAQGASVSDIVEVVVYDVFSVADTVSKSAGGTFDGNITAAGTLGVTGVVTANAGVVVDNITIDGTEIDLSSGDLTVDVAGDIILDADGGDVKFRDGGAGFFTISNSSLDAVLKVEQSNEDFIIKGNDGGSEITALTLDMSDAGTAIFGHDLKVADNNNMQFGAGADLILSSDGTNGTVANLTSNGDLFFKGNDGGSTITALTLDMSSAGKAIFNAGLAIGGTGDANTLDDYEEGTAFINITDASGNGYSMYEANGQYNRLTYTKIGRLVFFTIRIYTSSTSGVTGSDQARITGLPFTSINNQPAGGAKFQASYLDMNTSNALVMGGMVNDNSTTLFLNKQDTDGTYSDLTISELGSARIEVMGMYHSA